MLINVLDIFLKNTAVFSTVISLSNVIFFEELVSLIPPFLSLSNNFVFIVLLFWRRIIFIISFFTSKVSVLGLEEILTIDFDWFTIEPLFNVLEMVYTDFVQLRVNLTDRAWVKYYVIVSLLGLLLFFSLLQCSFLLLSLLLHPCWFSLSYHHKKLLGLSLDHRLRFGSCSSLAFLSSRRRRRGSCWFSGCSCRCRSRLCSCCWLGLTRFSSILILILEWCSDGGRDLGIKFSIPGSNRLPLRLVGFLIIVSFLNLSFEPAEKFVQEALLFWNIIFLFFFRWINLYSHFSLWWAILVWRVG